MVFFFIRNYAQRTTSFHRVWPDYDDNWDHRKGFRFQGRLLIWPTIQFYHGSGRSNNSILVFVIYLSTWTWKEPCLSQPSLDQISLFTATYWMRGGIERLSRGHLRRGSPSFGWFRTAIGFSARFGLCCLLSPLKLLTLGSVGQHVGVERLGNEESELDLSWKTPWEGLLSLAAPLDSFSWSRED